MVSVTVSVLTVRIPARVPRRISQKPLPAAPATEKITFCPMLGHVLAVNRHLHPANWIDGLFGTWYVRVRSGVVMLVRGVGHG